MRELLWRLTQSWRGFKDIGYWWDFTSFQAVEQTSRVQRLLQVIRSLQWLKISYQQVFGSLDDYVMTSMTAVYWPNQYHWFGALIFKCDGAYVAILLPWTDLKTGLAERDCLILTSRPVRRVHLDYLATRLLSHLHMLGIDPDWVLEQAKLRMDLQTSRAPISTPDD